MVNIKRRDALDAIVEVVPKRIPIVATMGLISRELYETHDSDQTFYMVGSLGLASSIGFGIAINKPDTKVVVIDGDASLLMNMGSVATIGHYKPKNLIHIVLDNHAYGSCSEEPSVSPTAKLDEIAKVVGYSKVYSVDNEERLKGSLSDALYIGGPTFILADVELGGKRDFARPLNLPELKKRFQEFLYQK